MSGQPPLRPGGVDRDFRARYPDLCEGEDGVNVEFMDPSRLNVVLPEEATARKLAVIKHDSDPQNFGFILGDGFIFA